MSIRRGNRFVERKKIYIFSEGQSERNYFEALKGNSYISSNYTINNDNFDSDVFKLIRTSDDKIKFLKGVDIIKVFIFDADKFENGELDVNNQLMVDNKDIIYLSRDDFENFLNNHLTKSYYRNNKKPNFIGSAVLQIRGLTLNEVKNMSNCSSYNGFKTPKDLIIELYFSVYE